MQFFTNLLAELQLERPVKGNILRPIFFSLQYPRKVNEQPSTYGTWNSQSRHDLFFLSRKTFQRLRTYLWALNSCLFSCDSDVALICVRCFVDATFKDTLVSQIWQMSEGNLHYPKRIMLFTSCVVCNTILKTKQTSIKAIVANPYKYNVVWSFPNSSTNRKL